MKELACRYSVARFVPDVMRDEPFNIGIILQCPEQQHISVRFLDDFTHIVKAHPEVNKEILASFTEEMTERIREHMEGVQLEFGEVPFEEPIALTHPQFLDYLFAEYGARFQFTRPRGTLATDLSEEIEDLFDLLVAAKERVIEAVEVPRRVRPEQVRRMVRRTFRKTKVIDYLEEDTIVSGRRWKYRIDYTYDTRIRGLVNSFSLDLDPDSKIDRAFWMTGLSSDIHEADEYREFTAIVHPPHAASPEGYDEALAIMRDREVQVIEVPRLEPFAKELLAKLEQQARLL